MKTMFVPALAGVAAVTMAAAAVLGAPPASASDHDDPPMDESSAETMAIEIAEQYPDFERARVGGLGRGDGQQAAFVSPDGDRWVTATLSYAPGMTLEEIRPVATHDGALASELAGDVLTVFNVGGDTSVIRQPSADTHVVVIVTAGTSDGMTLQQSDGSEDAEAHTLASEITEALRAR